MQRNKNIYGRSIVADTICIFLVGIIVFYSSSFAKEEERKEMNHISQCTINKPDGKISIEIDNSMSFLSSKKMYYKLLLSEDTIMSMKSEKIEEEFETKYETNVYQNRSKKVCNVIDLKELDSLIYKNYAKSWWTSNTSQNDLIKFIYPNKNYSYVIFDKLTGAALIDLKTKNIVHYFRNGKHFVWNNEGSHFVYDSTLSSPDFKQINNITFSVINASQNQITIKKNILKETPEEMEMISNFAWSPDSQYIAVLKLKVVHVSWTKILGHGTATLTYKISVFNLLGDLLYSKQIDGQFKGNFVARMIWERN